MPSSEWLVLLRRFSRTSIRADLRREPGLRFEDLEARDVPAAGVFTPSYVLIPHSGGGVTSFGSQGPTGMSPASIRHAYGFDQVSYTGAGTTIAIVDAYDDPTIASDLHAFDQQFGLPDPAFSKVSQTGGVTLPAANTGWAGEISLDVEWAHAVAPGANILLVEANSASYSDLFTAVDYAAQQKGVVAVSMSFGGGEFSGEASYDSHFVAPTGHPVVFVASSGDNGAPTSYPSVSPNVLSVGGTTLRVDSSGNYLSEAGWGGSGGGVSAYEKLPAYQSGFAPSAAYRTNPDVGYDADPNTGFAVYETYGNSTAASGSPWLQYGGTSDAAPQWAALIALADQGRGAAGQAALSSATLLPAIYSLPATDFHDVTTGTSTGSPNYTAGAGYDLVTGRGSPIANKVIADLITPPGSPPPVSPPPAPTPPPTATHFSASAPSSEPAGMAFTVTITALSSSNATVTGFTGTVHFTSSDGQAALPGDYMFTAADVGKHTFTVTLKTAGTDTITATSGSLTGSQSLTVTPGTPTHLAFAQQPTNVTVGTVISPAVTVTELDAFGNVATQVSGAQLNLTLGANPGGAALAGGSATVSHGVATFAGVSLNQPGTGYTLAASGAGLTGATSAAFTVSATTGTVIEAFESGLGNYYYTGGATPRATTSAAAAHDGTYGLLDAGDGDWYLRTDAAAKINPGDTAAVWTRFVTAADGRAYFGFGTTTSGTLSAVLAPNTGQLLIQNNSGFGYTDLASAAQAFQANHWYRVEVAWGTSGKVTVRLYDSDGKTLLNTLTAATGGTTAGGFAFRATGSTKDWDTVTVTRGVNAFAAPAPTAPAALAAPSVAPAAPPAATDWASLLVGASTRPAAAAAPTTALGFFQAPQFSDPFEAIDVVGGKAHSVRI